jgi:hypothetical protein
VARNQSGLPAMKLKEPAATLEAIPKAEAAGATCDSESQNVTRYSGSDCASWYVTKMDGPCSLSTVELYRSAEPGLRSGTGMPDRPT